MGGRPLILFLLGLALLIAVPLLLSQHEEEKQPSALPQFSLSASLSEAGIANNGNSTICFALLSLNGTEVEEGSITILLLGEEPKDNILLLDHPAIEADNYADFRRSLQSALSVYNLSVKPVSPSGLQNIKNSTILVPTGLFPASLNKDIPRLIENGNAIIYLGHDLSYLLNDDGSIIQNENKTIDFSDASLIDENSVVSNGSGHFMNIPKTLNDFKDADDAAQYILDALLSSRYQKPISTASFPLNGSFSGERTFLTEGDGAVEGFARIIYSAHGRNGSSNGIITRLAGKETGDLIGPNSSFSGEEMGFKLFLNESYPQPVFLLLHLLIEKDGKEISSQKIGEANVMNVWFSSFSVTNSLEPGDYLLSIVDQFNGRHGSAALHVKNLSVSVIKVIENSYIFDVLLDGKPVDGERAIVSIDGGDKTVPSPVSAGRMSVMAKLPKGEHAFNVLIFGRTVTVPYKGADETPVDVYIRYGIPGLLLIAVVYIAFRQRPRRKYLLHVPDAGGEKGEVLSISKEEFLGIFNALEKEFGWKKVPLLPEELSYGIKKHLSKGGRELIVTDDNVSEELERLVKKGDVSSYGDYYALSSWLGRNDIVSLSLRRIVRDTLIEKGIHFSENGVIRAKTGGIETHFYVFKNIRGILGMNERAKRVVLFKDSKHLSLFKRSLLEGGEERIRISLAIQNGSVFLITPDKLGEVI
jgi:hypothetical protein